MNSDVDSKPRDGWEEQFCEMHERGDDKLTTRKPPLSGTRMSGNW